MTSAQAMTDWRKLPHALRKRTQGRQADEYSQRWSILSHQSQCKTKPLSILCVAPALEEKAIVGERRIQRVHCLRSPLRVRFRSERNSQREEGATTTIDSSASTSWPPLLKKKGPL